MKVNGHLKNCHTASCERWWFHATLQKHSTNKMKIIAHTPYGVFESIEEDYDKDRFKSIAGKLEKELLETPIFVFNYAQGEIYLTSEMIKQSLFILEK